MQPILTFRYKNVLFVGRVGRPAQKMCSYWMNEGVAHNFPKPNVQRPTLSALRIWVENKDDEVWLSCQKLEFLFCNIATNTFFPLNLLRL